MAREPEFPTVAPPGGVVPVVFPEEEVDVTDTQALAIQDRGSGPVAPIRSDVESLATEPPKAPDPGRGESIGKFAVAGVPKLFDEEREGSRTDQTAVMSPISMRTGERPSLTVVTGGGAGQVFPIDQERMIIGRSRDAQMRLLDPGVSRHHTRISRMEDGACIVEDLGSTNGTLLNGRRIERSELKAGDRVQLGPAMVLQFSYLDETEDKLARELYEASTRDSLTRAYNRKYFFERLDAEVSYSARHQAPLCLVIFDLDHFKRVNDTHGHAAGDVLLRAVADQVHAMTRPEDVFSRYGGEEFVLLARGISIDGGIGMAERLREAIASLSIDYGGQQIGITISVGVAELTECKPMNVETLTASADQRLFGAKKLGRNRVCAE